VKFASGTESLLYQMHWKCLQRCITPSKVSYDKHSTSLSACNPPKARGPKVWDAAAIKIGFYSLVFICQNNTKFPSLYSLSLSLSLSNKTGAWVSRTRTKVSLSAVVLMRPTSRAINSLSLSLSLSFLM
jgi:hypothetical protein